jgi:hypothetical protein
MLDECSQALIKIQFTEILIISLWQPQHIRFGSRNFMITVDLYETVLPVIFMDDVEVVMLDANKLDKAVVDGRQGMVLQKMNWHGTTNCWP